MKLFASLYFDEDVDVLVAKLLMGRGFDAVTARDEGKLNTPDPIHLAYAASLDRCVFTHNRLHYEALHK